MLQQEPIIEHGKGRFRRTSELTSQSPPSVALVSSLPISGFASLAVSPIAAGSSLEASVATVMLYNISRRLVMVLESSSVPLLRKGPPVRRIHCLG